MFTGLAKVVIQNYPREEGGGGTLCPFFPSHSYFYPFSPPVHLHYWLNFFLIISIRLDSKYVPIDGCIWLVCCRLLLPSQKSSSVVFPLSASYQPPPLLSPLVIDRSPDNPPLLLLELSFSSSISSVLQPDGLFYPSLTQELPQKELRRRSQVPITVVHSLILCFSFSVAQITEKIDKELLAEQEKLKRTFKILILGGPASGKSTIFKQMR